MQIKTLLNVIIAKSQRSKTQINKIQSINFIKAQLNISKNQKPDQYLKIINKLLLIEIQIYN